VIQTDLSGLELCMQYVPTYSAHLIGPVPLGESEPIQVTIACITRENIEDAEAVVWEHVLTICNESNYPFDPSEWVLANIWLVNGN